MSFDFDQPVERRGTWSERWERYAGRDVVPLWVADTDFRAPPAVLAALQRRIEHGVFGYTRVPQELIDALVARMRARYGWRIDPSWVVMLPGTVAGLHLAVRRLTQPGERVLLPRPVYHHFERAARLAPRPHEVVPQILSEGRWVWDSDRLVELGRAGARLLLLCNPQNPGGTVSTRAELGVIAEVALRHELIVCCDEIHADLVLDTDKRHVPFASLAPEISRRTVTLVSPNKAFNVPGTGCAMAIIENAELRRAFSIDLHGALPDVPVFAIAAAIAAYSECEDWLDAQLAYLRANRDLVESEVAKMPALSLAHVEASYLAWIDARGLGKPDAGAHLLAHGLALSPGEQFGAPGFVRLNFGTQRTLLLEGLARLRKAAEA
jgi:cystathionine beta-lyase